MFDKDLGNRATLFILLTAIQYTDLCHGVLRRTWRGPRIWCLLRGDKSEESDGGRGEAPARCVFAAASVRQPARGPDSVVPLCRTVGTVAAATTAWGPAWRWPVRCRAICFHCFLLRLWTARWRRLQVQKKVVCRTGLVLSGQCLSSGVVLTVLMSHSNRSGFSSFVLSSPRVNVPI